MTHWQYESTDYLKFVVHDQNSHLKISLFEITICISGLTNISIGRFPIY